MKALITSLAILLHLLSYLASLTLALPTPVTKPTGSGDGVWRLPRTLGGGDLPKVIVVDVLIIEQPTTSPADAPVIHSLPQLAPAPALIPRPMPIGPLRFTPLSKVNNKIRRSLYTNGKAGSLRVIKKRDVDVDGRPGPVLVVDKNMPKTILRVESAGNRYIRRNQLDGETRPVTVIKERADRPGTTNVQPDPKKSSHSNSPAKLILGKDGITSTTPISGILGETLPSMTGFGRGMPGGLILPGQLMGKAKVPPGLLRV